MAKVLLQLVLGVSLLGLCCGNLAIEELFALLDEKCDENVPKMVVAFEMHANYDNPNLQVTVKDQPNCNATSHPNNTYFEYEFVANTTGNEPCVFVEEVLEGQTSRKMIVEINFLIETLVELPGGIVVGLFVDLDAKYVFSCIMDLREMIQPSDLAIQSPNAQSDGGVTQVEVGTDVDFKIAFDSVDTIWEGLVVQNCTLDFNDTSSTILENGCPVPVNIDEMGSRELLTAATRTNSNSKSAELKFTTPNLPPGTTLLITCRVQMCTDIDSCQYNTVSDCQGGTRSVGFVRYARAISPLARAMPSGAVYSISKSLTVQEPTGVTAVTCTRDRMVIIARGSASTDKLHVDDSDQTNDGTALNGCKTNLVADTSSPNAPKYTLTVDFQITPNSLALANRPTYPGNPTGTCPANTWPQASTGEQIYQKYVVWTTGDNVQVEDNPPTGPGSTKYVITCTFKDIHSTDTGIANIEAHMAFSTQVPPSSPKDPIPSFSVTKAGGTDIFLNDELTMTVGFTDDDSANYWEFVTVKSCEASSTSNFNTAPRADLVTNGCPVQKIGDHTDLITSMQYTEASSTGTNSVASYNDRRVLTMKFKAFRFNTVRNVVFKCSVVICPYISSATNCPIPNELMNSVSISQASTCTTIPARNYKDMMMGSRAGEPHAYPNTVTVEVIVNDLEGGESNDKICMDIKMFAVLAAVLSLLLILAIAVAVGLCVRGHRSATSKDFQIHDGVANTMMVKSI